MTQGAGTTAPPSTPTSPRGWRPLVAMLGPAFVAAIAYVDPGNVATNTSAGAIYGYTLVWVVVAANAMAAIVQYLSARLGIITEASLPQLVADRARREGRLAYWLQAQVTTLATDLAEVVGGAVALHLLFDIPLVLGALITVAVSLVILMFQGEKQRTFEITIFGMLLIIAIGFLAGLVVGPPDPARLAGGLVPQFAGSESLVLAAGMLGATVMPHAVYLHSALLRDQAIADRNVDRRLNTTRLDIGAAMVLAGAVNLGLLLVAAQALEAEALDGTLDAVHAGLRETLGTPVSVLFAIALLASGLASTAVGTYAGSVVMGDMLRAKAGLWLRRLLTALPAVVILGLGVDATTALVWSQVVLSLGVPFALVPLIVLNRDRALVGTRRIGPGLTAVTWVIVVAVVSLNVALLLSMVLG